MASFCPNCGRQLQDGQTCTCSYAAPVASAPTSNIFTGVINLIKSIFKAPATATAKYIKAGEMPATFILMGAQAFLVALISLIIAIHFDNRNANPFVFFLLGGMGSFALSMIHAVALFGFSKIFKGNMDFKKGMCASAVNSLVLVPFLSFAFFVVIFLEFDASYAPITVPAVIAGIGCVLSNAIIGKALPEAAEISEDKAVFVDAITSVAMLASTAIIWTLLTAIIDFSGLTSIGKLLF